MLDVKKLERRWLKYKIKKFTPYLLVVFSIFIVTLVALFWLDHQSQNIQTPSSKKETKNLSKQPESKPVFTVEENTTILEPSMGFVQNFASSPLPEVAPNQTTMSIPKQPLNSSPYPPVKSLEMPEYNQPLKTPPSVASKQSTNPNTLSINRNESKINIDDLKVRFKETSNANLGLFIARYYFDHGEYDEAYNYALKTNTINSRIDESWIIFSKSLVKLGKTDQAKKTLQLYISQSNSESAKALLDSIEKGSFR